MPVAQNNKSSKPVSKSEFVRSLPESIPAKEVVERAKKAGLEMSDKYVYVVRSNARKKDGRRRRRKAAVVVAAAPAATPTEKEFRRLTLELGVKKAETILTDTKKRLADIISGN